MQPAHDPVPGHLGDHRGGRDARCHPVALPHGEARDLEAVDAEPVGEHVRGAYGQPGEGATQGLDVGDVHAERVAVAGREHHDRPGQRAVEHLGVAGLAPGRCQQLGVGQPGDDPPPTVGKHRGGGHQRTGTGTTPGLVDAGDRVEPGASQRPLVAVQPRVSADGRSPGQHAHRSRAYDPSRAGSSKISGLSRISVAAGRPDDRPDLAHDTVHRYETAAGLSDVQPRVAGLRTVVTHDPQRAVGDLDVERLLRGPDPVHQVVGLVQAHPVDLHLALGVAAADLVATDPDDPLHQVPAGRVQAERLQGALHDVARLLALRGAEPAAGVVEDHDVAAFDVAGPVRPLLDQDAVLLDERGLHRHRGHEERLDEEGLDDDRQHQGQPQQDDDLLPQRQRLLVLVVGRAVLGIAGGAASARARKAFPHARRRPAVCALVGRRRRPVALVVGPCVGRSGRRRGHRGSLTRPTGWIRRRWERRDAP